MEEDAERQRPGAARKVLLLASASVIGLGLLAGPVGYDLEDGIVLKFAVADDEDGDDDDGDEGGESTSANESSTASDESDGDDGADGDESDVGATDSVGERSQDVGSDDDDDSGDDVADGDEESTGSEPTIQEVTTLDSGGEGGEGGDSDTNSDVAEGDTLDNTAVLDAVTTGWTEGADETGETDEVSTEDSGETASTETAATTDAPVN